MKNSWSSEACEDEVLDSFIRLALSQHSEAEGRSVWLENDRAKLKPQFACSSEFESRILRRSAARRRLESLRDFLFGTYKHLVPIAVAFFIISSSFLTIFAVSDDFREAIYRMVFKEETRYIEFTPDLEHRAFIDPEVYDILEHGFALTYVPSGFVFESTDGSEIAWTVDYENAEGQFISFRQSVNAISRVDNENVTKQERIFIGDSYGMLTLTNEGLTILTWQAGEKILTIIADIGEAEVLKVAEGIKVLR